MADQTYDEFARRRQELGLRPETVADACGVSIGQILIWSQRTERIPQYAWDVLDLLEQAVKRADQGRARASKSGR